MKILRLAELELMEVQRPSPQTQPFVADFDDPVEFFRERLLYRRKIEKGFSVAAVCRQLRRLSPALVTLLLQRKRKITLDRIEELAILMDLSAPEKAQFQRLVLARNPSRDLNGDSGVLANSQSSGSRRSRKQVSLHLLNDWLNVYVKDSFQIPAVQKNPELVFELLENLASRKRIERSLRFLLAEGYLRRTVQGTIEVDTPLSVAESPVSSQKIRKFHQAALRTASYALEIHPIDRRFANTMVIPLNKTSYQKLVTLIQEFAQTAMSFAEDETQDPETLYQMIVNLSPASGRTR